MNQLFLPFTYLLHIEHAEGVQVVTFLVGRWI